MKRFFALALACLLLLGLAACGGNEDNPATSPEPTPTQTSGKTLAEGQTRPALALIREVEKDGLLLRVESDYAYKFTEEPFILTATVTNTTGKDITYGVGSGTPNVHKEMLVNIPGFTDMDIYGKMFNEMYMFATLKAGESFTETIRFMPGIPRSSSVDDVALPDKDINWLPAGEYEGTAVFTYYPNYDPANPGEAKQLQLEFSVILF